MCVCKRPRKSACVCERKKERIMFISISRIIITYELLALIQTQNLLSTQCM